MARFFIDRPIFAWVIAIVMMLAGVLSIYNLPVEQYPTVAPPEVTIEATYPGASAKVVEDSVTQVIEQQMNGIDNLLYITSTSDSAGNAQIAITFAPGTNPDIAQVQVQNKLQLATPLLPQEVQQQGVQVTKSSDSFLMVMAFNSKDGSMSRSDLADFVAANVQDPMSRVQGVGQIQLFGSQYAMRIWLNPDDLNQYNLTPADVIAAVDSAQLRAALEKRSVHPVGSDERVLVFIPKRNIESWARWGETGQVDETQDHKNQYRDGGKKYGAQVAQRCLGSSNDPGPRSIQKACEEIQRVV